MLSYVLMICVCHNALSNANSLDSRFTDTMRLNLDYLCPGANICNTSAPVENQTEVVDDAGLKSCCRGCSCHKDCDVILDCCFPRVQTDLFIENENTTNDNETNETSTLPLSVSGNDSTSDEHTPSLKQCIYSQTGIPDDESWPTTVPAYSIVSKPPPSGCKTYNPHQAQTEGIPLVSCGTDAVEAWGDLFPVYSAEHREIYKNERCARCHGVYEYITWIPTLVCDTLDEDRNRDIPISEHFAFLEQKPFSNRCFVSFHYHDRAVMVDNRCYVDTVHTCPYSVNDERFPVSKGLNLTASEITAACTSGLNAPIETKGYAFQNIFCALCNSQLSIQGLQQKCINGHTRKTFGSTKLTYLLDISALRRKGGSRETRNKAQLPVACMRNATKWVQQSCRNVYCPTGQVRNTKGHCKFPSLLWYRGHFSIIAKLKYVINNTSILAMVTSGRANQDDIINSIRDASPWPSNCVIHKVYHSSEDEDTDSGEGLIAVQLIAKTVRPAILVKHIRRSIKLPWKIDINGTNFLFEQSLLDYTIDMRRGRSTFNYGPRWKGHVNVSDLPSNLTMSAPVTWISLYWVLSFMKTIPYAVSKLITCDQVSLEDGEYSLMAKNYLLVNKLSGRVMFDREFELVGDQDCKLVPRICLVDSPLALKQETSGGSSVLHDKALPKVLIFTHVVQQLCLCLVGLFAFV